MYLFHKIFFIQEDFLEGQANFCRNERKLWNEIFKLMDAYYSKQHNNWVLPWFCLQLRSHQKSLFRIVPSRFDNQSKPINMQRNVEILKIVLEIFHSSSCISFKISKNRYGNKDKWIIRTQLAASTAFPSVPRSGSLFVVSVDPGDSFFFSFRIAFNISPCCLTISINWSTVAFKSLLVSFWSKSTFL